MKFNTLHAILISSQNREISNMALEFSRNLVLAKFSENKVGENNST